jgi:transcriptional regulator with XRE-family HTH domain
MSTAKLKKVEETFSERLKMLRKERGWSQEDLARRLDVSPGSVGNWEMGPHEPHPKTLRKIAALFEVDVLFLLRGEREEESGVAPNTVGLREGSPEYKAVNLGELLREVEDARDRLERIAVQLRGATTKPSAAAALTEVAAAGYEQKRTKGRT